MDITFDKLKKSVTNAGYKWFSTGKYNLNIVGVRSVDNESNAFNDLMCVAYNDGKNDILHTFKITTDPGTFYRENPLNVLGTAVVAEGQHSRLWTFGKHKGRYDALVQATPVDVYRDNDRDDTVNAAGKTISGMYGINCHHARYNGESTQVDKWSAGCQVFANYYDFLFFLALCHRASAEFGDTFTYTLIGESDVAK